MTCENHMKFKFRVHKVLLEIVTLINLLSMVAFSVQHQN